MIKSSAVLRGNIAITQGNETNDFEASIKIGWDYKVAVKGKV